MSIYTTEIDEEKRQAVLRILEKVIQVWPLAYTFHSIVRSVWCTPDFLDMVIQRMDIAMSMFKDQEEVERMQTAINNLQVMQKKEKNERQKDWKDADQLLKNSFD